MKLKFKTQARQTAAVQAVLDCFDGQPPTSAGSVSHRIDPRSGRGGLDDMFADGFENADMKVSARAPLANIQQVQRRQNLPVPAALSETKVSRLHLDVEKESSSGKTCCYVRTMFGLKELYGGSNFIVLAPGIASRERLADSRVQAVNAANLATLPPTRRTECAR